MEEDQRVSKIEEGKGIHKSCPNRKIEAALITVTEETVWTLHFE